MGRKDSSDNDEWRDFTLRLGLQIHRLRVARGLSQEAVAYRAGLTRFTYQRYERGEAQSGLPANPSLRTLVAVSQVLDVPIVELLPPDLPDMTVR